MYLCVYLYTQFNPRDYQFLLVILNLFNPNQVCLLVCLFVFSQNRSDFAISRHPLFIVKHSESLGLADAFSPGFKDSWEEQGYRTI